MRFPDEVRKCVVFVGYKNLCTDKPEYLGTAFFVSRQTSYPDIRLGYLVTAAHVLRNDRDATARAEYCIRCNLRSGDDPWCLTQYDDWYFHNDEKIDAAVLPLDMDGTTYDVMSFPLPTEPPHAEIGDEVITTGMFYYHKGISGIQPVVRTGHIAALPHDEEFRSYSETGREFRFTGYLIESHSLGGLSGSPVFLQLENEDKTISKSKEKLLGINVSHFPIDLLNCSRLDMSGHSGTKEDAMEQDSKDLIVRLNAGFAAVVPISRVIEIIETKLKEIDTQRFERMKRKASLVVDSPPGYIGYTAPYTGTDLDPTRYQH